jgi:hypothetical protein
MFFMSRVANDTVQRLSAPVAGLSDVLRRIEAEYREMPGLNVTEAQARRLWGLDRTTCRRALDTLVDRGVLRCTVRKAYVRAAGAQVVRGNTV